MMVIQGGQYNCKPHLYTHEAVKPKFKCELSSTEYIRSGAYNKHMMMHNWAGHSDKNLFVCSNCEHGFTRKDSLVNHIRTSARCGGVMKCSRPKKRFTCTACRESFCEQRLLQHHIRKNHFNLSNKEINYDEKKVNETWVEKVSKTGVCVEITKVNENVFSIKKVDGHLDIKDGLQESVGGGIKGFFSSVLAVKRKTQYSKAKCSFCDKEMLKKSLGLHIKEHHLNVRKFSCDICKSTFKRHYQLVGHICGKFKPRRRHRGLE